MLRLLSHILAAFAVVFILSVGAQQLGLPVLSLIAGLGIGGLAVALAIRPTLENLIASFILYIDRPVRVGDFCSFGDKDGTIEAIGVRSTAVRARDRTLINIPNAQLANMEITNWAQCDLMLIQTTLGLRYETSTDQMRYVLMKIREMCHAHPAIDSDTVRVRFMDFGGSSLDIDLRVYAKTLEWNAFYAVREDILLRVAAIVEESGTGFAFPSTTLYMTRDDGLDTARTEHAEKEIQSLRRRGRLPFPVFDRQKVEAMEDSLDYPPKGSSSNSKKAEAEEEPQDSFEPLSDRRPAEEEAKDKDKDKEGSNDKPETDEDEKKPPRS